MKCCWIARGVRGTIEEESRGGGDRTAVPLLPRSQRGWEDVRADARLSCTGALDAYLPLLASRVSDAHSRVATSGAHCRCKHFLRCSNWLAPFQCACCRRTTTLKYIRNARQSSAPPRPLLRRLRRRPILSPPPTIHRHDANATKYETNLTHAMRLAYLATVYTGGASVPGAKSGGYSVGP